MPKIRVNGREIEAPPGRKLLQVCLDHGIFIPHFCWHPGLSPAGNCRMCLVKVSNSRKLEASCMIDPVEGLEVWTDTPEVLEARKSVLEYLLINHPLDCPICDKAGECRLQDYTYSWRGGLSRFGESKNLRPTKDLGPRIRIWGNRCIVCTRCVRFCEEIAGTGELCVVQRGDRSVVDVFPGIPLDNPLSLNTVDLCPVGALNNKEFLYQARVWFTRQVESLCPSCSRGCNLKITVLDNRIRRMVPRPNPEVNRYWLCDEGRSHFRYVAGPGRLRVPRGTAREIVDAARRWGMAGVISTYQTVEEIFLFRELMKAVQARAVGFLTLTRGDRRVFRDGFSIEPDRTPNRAWAETLFGREAVAAGVRPVAEALREGTARALLVVNGIPDLEWPAELLEAARGAEFLAVADLRPNPLTERASVVLPAAAWAEKEGIYMNVDGRFQRLRKAVEPPAGVRPEIVWLQEALRGAGAGPEPVPAEEVFRRAVPGLDYSKVGSLGIRDHGGRS